MVRDEEEFVEEFVEYHTLIGVQHVHVYLHLSADATAHRLEKFVERGLVTLRAWDFDWSPMWIRYQTHALNDCLLRSLANAPDQPWMMLMDVDEFLVPSAALARIGQSRETLFSPRGATEHEAVTRALSSLIPNTLALLHQE
eukprot:CAMPEP_0179419060 /NCGR_PEP_ID=MMETSP0799-20121207/8384_1 /TAXON_ID=46947 /ORGANISM="Geminigera cryophila, Strain CCMP2564" /LENGTH=141 /DNA_ID=CAMNT_0021192481 /DNA_START=171 /DNA_END=593 /DNA_ORIENTATION=+